MSDSDAGVCEHVLAERRTSVSSSLVESFDVIPPIIRRKSSVTEQPRVCRRHSTGCGQRPYGFRYGDSSQGPSRHPTPQATSRLPSITARRASPVQEVVVEIESGDSDWSRGRTVNGSDRSNEKRSASESTARDPSPNQAFNEKPPNKPDCNTDLEANGGERERTWSLWASESVATNALVPALVTHALSTGLLDATTYADFHTFASNQTGNAILLTLSAVGTVHTLILLTGVSFGGFIIGAFVFGQIGHRIGVRKRAWLLTSTIFQTLCLVVAAILLSPGGPSVTALGGKHEWVVLFLFATMSGSQVAMARQSSCQELPTAPMTSTFVDFMADHYLFAGWTDARATSRNRRLYYVVVMLGGSFIGAMMHRWCNSWSVVVIAVGIKLGALVLLGLAKPDPSK